MKRLVYSPKINAYIKADSGVYDVSDYIVDFSIDRKVNQVSSAQLTLRNPNKKWTNFSYTNPSTGQKETGPVFHPMDPITILLTRLRNRPVQVFTGYCDSTPYLQLFPGTVQLTASCTLKRLLYTFFDPGLPFMMEFLAQYGWTPSQSTGGIVHPAAEQQKANQAPRYDDSGIGELLFHVLTQIGGWDPNTIYIEKMPASVIQLVSNLFDLFKADAEESSQELTSFLHQIIGTSELGGGGSSVGTPTGTAGGSGPPPKSAVTPVDVGRAMLTAGFPSDRTVLAQGMAVVSIESGFGGSSADWVPNSADCIGYWQIQLSTHASATPERECSLVTATEDAYVLWKACSGGSFKCDWYDFEGSSSGAAQQYQQYLSKADEAIKQGPFVANSPRGTTHIKGGKFTT